MKKLWLALIAVLSACSADKTNNEALSEQEVRCVSVGIKDIENEGAESRVAYQSDTKKYLWEKNDTLGIFPNVGGQVEFPIDESNVGTSFAEFNGGGWALKANYYYSAYYPFNFYNRKVEAIPFSYLGQVQDGDASLAHLGDYLFMGASPTPVENGALTFDLGHLGNIIELSLTLPEAKTYTSLDVYTSSEIIPVKVNFNLKDSNLPQTSVEYSNRLSLGLKNIKTTSANQVVTVWMAFPVVSDAEKTLKAVVKDSQGYVYVADIYTSTGNPATVNFNRNKKRTLKASPVLTDGFTGGIEDWQKGEEIAGVAQ